MGLFGRPQQAQGLLAPVAIAPGAGIAAQNAAQIASPSLLARLGAFGSPAAAGLTNPDAERIGRESLLAFGASLLAASGKLPLGQALGFGLSGLAQRRTQALQTVLAARQLRLENRRAEEAGRRADVNLDLARRRTQVAESGLGLRGLALQGRQDIDRQRLELSRRQAQVAEEGLDIRREGLDIRREGQGRGLEMLRFPDGTIHTFRNRDPALDEALAQGAVKVPISGGERIEVSPDGSLTITRGGGAAAKFSAKEARESASRFATSAQIRDTLGKLREFQKRGVNVVGQRGKIAEGVGSLASEFDKKTGNRISTLIAGGPVSSKDIQAVRRNLSQLASGTREISVGPENRLSDTERKRLDAALELSGSGRTEDAIVALSRIGGLRIIQDERVRIEKTGRGQLDLSSPDGLRRAVSDLLDQNLEQEDVIFVIRALSSEQ